MMTHTKSKVLYYISMFIIVTAILLVAIASWFAFKPVNVVKPNVQPYKIITKVINPGDPVIYEADTCKYIAVPSVVIRRFVDQDGTRYPQPPEASNVKAGCGKIRIPMSTPFGIQPGTYYVDIEIAYQVNPLRKENYNFTTETFKVIRR